MSERLETLSKWSLSPPLLALANGRLPHPAFKSKCEPLQVEMRRSWGLELDRVQCIDQSRSRVALWEHDIGDGHAFEIVYCGHGERGLEFWNVMYADDMESPQAELIARTEQGLYFWLFFFLIGSEFAAHGERAYATLVAAADTVEFQYLKEIFALEQKIGSETDYPALLRENSVNIPASVTSSHTQ